MLIEKLKYKFDELKNDGISEDAILIAFKEELQHYILNFIYTSKAYSNLTMYGGTLLRIGYKLPRMSEDLDFQSSQILDLEKFAKDMEEYFKINYNFEIETQPRNRIHQETDLVTVKFDILKNFKFTSISFSKLKIRVDINHFADSDKFVKNTIPIIRDNFVYTIKTYPLSTLMASKTAAFLKRNERTIGSINTNAKPRDVYDMMWYMQQRIMPDLEYLKAKDIEFDTFLDFRDAVKLRASKIEDNAFRNDLAQFFYSPNELEGWLSNWRPKFVQLLDAYKAFHIGELNSISFYIDHSTYNRYINFAFSSKDNDLGIIFFRIVITDYWFRFEDIKIRSSHRIEEIESKIEKHPNKNFKDLDYEYIGLFYKKIVDYLERSKQVVYQNEFVTKSIMATADKLDPKKQICLDRRLLERIQFEELL